MAAAHSLRSRAFCIVPERPCRRAFSITIPRNHASTRSFMSATHFIAIAGNPNSGKTTVFNKYTGARQHVGNYPGITVEKKEGTATLDGAAVHLIDLPGTYSLTAYSQEEVVARKVLAEDKPGAVLNVLNAGVLERNLYLTVQLLEMGVPVVLALNMMDEARAQGVRIDVKKLEELMGVRALPTVARTGEGLENALREAVALGERRKGKERAPLVISYGPDIDAALMELTPLIEEARFLTDRYPARWIALKFLESDEEIILQGQAAAPELAATLLRKVDILARHLEATLRTYPEAVIADYRYGYISSILRQGVISGADELKNRIAYSDKIDTVLTNRFFGPLILVAVLYAMYVITFSLGEFPAGWLEDGFAWLSGAADAHLPDGLLKSLIISGVIDGVGGVFGFVPLIMIMFLLIAILEDSGYMARVAYMMDRLFRFFGLHGASVMPFIISGGIAGGCAVPGIMAARTLRSPKERLATILTAPFMTCGAKLPVFLLFVGIFFKENAAMVMFLLTLAGWAAALLSARLLRSTLIQGEATPFVMELPPYRLPTLSGVLIHTWERAWQYIKKAGTIILAISIVLWAAMTFPSLPEEKAEELFAADRAAIEAMEDGDARQEAVDALVNQEAAANLRYSVAGRIGTALEPVSAPAGFDWRTNIALVAGIAAKEVVVSTLGTAYSLGDVDPEENESLAARIAADPHWTKANATAMLLFTLLYSPCFVAVAVIRSETGSWKWAAFSVVFNLGLAYIVAVAANQLILALG